MGSCEGNGEGVTFASMGEGTGLVMGPEGVSVGFSGFLTWVFITRS